ncbi:hypothetical protein A2773_03035 [Candidatus Gottesmanbacteria bacterium RIFCSPHIGHO2_01_FULL_39_10]|uniref:Nucleoside 2-deoxyribosyltransferase n=1 Tax=Candidatus Gottesmanbacteria bacterium RIFCSPHIGHO2_01_FULL_39_10 TaxID=1798375 RepID=A0A1F5ZKW6_9BACT|nr:MAG: hypothetical protein A2773_03035 [Candidatus Gottesmanbacteria bacterium RIFCSPHIGHO2_01_FULL_39_10]
MKIFYTASFYYKDKYQKQYDLVLSALESMGVEVISPEKGNYKRLLSIKERGRLGGKPRLEHYAAIKKGINIADAVVIEISNEDFQLGHEATLAIQAKKHVLCLSVHEDFSEKIDNRYFHGAKYDEINIYEIVADFIEKVRGEKLSERFNCFLSLSQLEYLKKTSRVNQMTISEYLRKIIDQDRRF